VCIKAGLYSSVVAGQILDGNHYNRNVEAHEILIQALADLWIQQFFDENPDTKKALPHSIKKLADAFEDHTDTEADIKREHQECLVLVESLNLEKQFADFDSSLRHSMFPMFCWARMYMQRVFVLLAFHSSIKDQNLIRHHNIYVSQSSKEE